MKTLRRDFLKHLSVFTFAPLLPISIDTMIAKKQKTLDVNEFLTLSEDLKIIGNYFKFEPLDGKCASHLSQMVSPLVLSYKFDKPYTSIKYKVIDEESITCDLCKGTCDPYVKFILTSVRVAIVLADDVIIRGSNEINNKNS